MEVTTDSNSTLTGIDRYKHFGFKKEWVDMFVAEKDAMFGRLGKNMIPAARNWFTHSLLSTGKADTPAKLLDVALKVGTDHYLLWDLLWIGLSHHSALIKWFVCNCKSNVSYSVEDLHTLLGNVKESTKNGGIDSLKATFKWSPIGTGASALVHVERNGERIISIKRISHSVDPLVVLYGLYVMSQAADRASFTVSEMLAADFESACVSPLVAFGMSVEEFKAQCAGLAERYPEFIACSFTLGLDEVRIFPNVKTLDEVIDLILA